MYLSRYYGSNLFDIVEHLTIHLKAPRIKSSMGGYGKIKTLEGCGTEGFRDVQYIKAYYGWQDSNSRPFACSIASETKALPLRHNRFSTRK